MARQGRAGPALAIAAIGSFIAGCFATLVVAVAATDGTSEVSVETGTWAPACGELKPHDRLLFTVNAPETRILAALAVRSTMKAQSSSDDGSGQSDSGSDSSSSESESSSGSESDSDGEGEGDKENVDAVQTKLQGMSVKPLPGS
jgi:hypothetical protein